MLCWRRLCCRCCSFPTTLFLSSVAAPCPPSGEAAESAKLTAADTAAAAQQKAAGTAAAARDSVVGAAQSTQQAAADSAERAKQAAAPYVEGAKEVAGDTAAAAKGSAEVSGVAGGRVWPAASCILHPAQRCCITCACAALGLSLLPLLLACLLCRPPLTWAGQAPADWPRPQPQVSLSLIFGSTSTVFFLAGMCWLPAKRPRPGASRVAA